MDASMEQLVQAVTEQVMAMLKEEHDLPEPGSEGKESCLVLGENIEIPEELRQNAILRSIEDYKTHQNILRYDRLVIAKLSLADLADIAQGRPGSPEACAVCRALLQGVEILLLEGALSHRAFAGQGSTAFYKLLEGYVNTLQVFGIRLIRKNDPLLLLKNGKRAAKDPVRQEVRDARLVTEAMASELARDAQEVVVPATTLITPAAMDVFRAAHTVLIRK